MCTHKNRREAEGKRAADSEEDFLNLVLGTWTDEAGFIYDFSLNFESTSSPLCLTRSVPPHLLKKHDPPRAEKQRWADLTSLIKTEIIWGARGRNALLKADIVETSCGRVMRWFLPSRCDTETTTAQSCDVTITSSSTTIISKMTSPTAFSPITSLKPSVVLSKLQLSAVPVMLWVKSCPEDRPFSRLPKSLPPRIPPPPPPPQLANFLERRKQSMLTAFRESYRLQRMIDREKLREKG